MARLSINEVAKVMNQWRRFAKRMKINPVLAAKMMSMHFESLGEPFPDGLPQRSKKQNGNLK